MKKCITTPFALSEVSGCPIDKPECDFAQKFGFSIVCRHPEHARFHERIAVALTNGEVQKPNDTLRNRRCDDFKANPYEAGRRAFCLQTGFYGPPLLNMEEKQTL